MRAKKPQTRLTGASLVKSPKPKVSKSVKPNITAKHRPSASTVKSASTKKSTPKNSTANAKTKDDSENNEKKSKPISKTETSPLKKEPELNSKEKSANRKKPKSEKKSNTSSTVNGEKKSATVKDEKPSKSSKELKNLDIQLCGYSSVAAVAKESTGSDSDTDRIIKASICENVKTKARAASATFNSSGNRSPSVSSPGPNNAKQNLIHEKSNQTETALKCTENRSDEKPKKKKEPTKPKTPAKLNSPKASEDQDKSKKSNNENQKIEADKSAIKSHKAKAKPSSVEAIKTIEAPVATAEKTIEIKTQIDESKSLIDTITEAINEVVKQYNDSNNVEAPGPHTNGAKTSKKSSKIVKTTKKKLLNEKKLEVIASATDLLNESKGAIKTISKKTKAKPKPKLVNDNKTDDKNGDQAKPSSETENKAAATNPNASLGWNSEIAKKSNDKPIKVASKAKAKLKPDKKTTIPEQTEAKGSKMIKIDLKAKKRVKSLATVKSASLKTAMKQLQSKMTKEPKVCQEDIKKNDDHKSAAETDEMSDDDNLSLTELKAQLTKSDTKKTDSDAKSSKAKPKQDSAATTSSTNKQKPTKSSFKKPSVSNAATSTAKKNKLTSQKEIGATSNAMSESSDVYEFQDANFSGEEIPYVHKKKREKILSHTVVSHEKTQKANDDIKNGNDKSKTLPLKKQNRHETLKTGVKQTKATSPVKSSSKTNNRNVSDGKAEKGENDTDSKISETKKSAKAKANKAKLVVKNRRMKFFGFYSGPKRHRMASLNALAKVQCLYENESRTAQELGFVKEPQNVQRMKIVSEMDKNEPNSVKSQAKDKEAKLENEKKEKKLNKKDVDVATIPTEREVVAVSNRTLRNVPGLRGEGKLWEMENSSMDESSTEKDEERTVSLNSIGIAFDLIFPSNL